MGVYPNLRGGLWMKTSPLRLMPGRVYRGPRVLVLVKQNHRRQIAVLSLLALTGLASRGLDGPDKRRRASWMSQKQSLLIASPSGRGARTQDHLGIIYMPLYLHGRTRLVLI